VTAPARAAGCRATGGFRLIDEIDQAMVDTRGCRSDLSSQLRDAVAPLAD